MNMLLIPASVLLLGYGVLIPLYLLERTGRRRADRMAFALEDDGDAAIPAVGTVVRLDKQIVKAKTMKEAMAIRTDLAKGLRR